MLNEIKQMLNEAYSTLNGCFFSYILVVLLPIIYVIHSKNTIISSMGIRRG